MPASQGIFCFALKFDRPLLEAWPRASSRESCGWLAPKFLAFLTGGPPHCCLNQEGNFLGLPQPTADLDFSLQIVEYVLRGVIFPQLARLSLNSRINAVNVRRGRDNTTTICSEIL
jgi:hypothetical protein